MSQGKYRIHVAALALLMLGCSACSGEEEHVAAAGDSWGQWWETAYAGSAQSAPLDVTEEQESTMPRRKSIISVW